MSYATTCCSLVSWVHYHIPLDFPWSESVDPWCGVVPFCYPNTVVGLVLMLALLASPSNALPNAAHLMFFLTGSYFLSLIKRLFVSALVSSPSLLYLSFPCFPNSFLLFPCLFCLKPYYEVVVHIIQSYLPFLRCILLLITFVNFLFPLEEGK